MKNRALFKNNSKVSFWKKSIGSQPSNKSYNNNSKIFGISPWVKDLPMMQMSSGTNCVTSNSPTSTSYAMENKWKTTS
ncbi:hypothetical protein EB796_021957 [Bugula neritina]|uniref:Uncharacterized protein n=1 Tax=Bugula neritina TaxID=10212 RepID=A0A7J7J0M1_BUGNE|nr:hypothetical protein EB796_021957 [Bugula neritina]